MLDIVDAPVLDKDRLVGGCVRLPFLVNAQTLRSEIANMPQSVWGHRAARAGVHEVAEAVFLRGFAPSEGDKPIDDRPALEHLPYVRSIIEGTIKAPRLRCLLARLPPRSIIRPHKDLPPYFAKSLRVHIPVETNDQVHMVSAGHSYQMCPGEVWVLNNSTFHAVWNGHPTQSRTHLICDFLPSPHLLESLATGDRDRGERRPDVFQYLAEAQDEWRRSRA